MEMLWRNNKTDYAVLIPERFSPTELHAANELVKFIGRGLKIKEDNCISAENDESIISIGNTSVLKKYQPDLSDVYADGYRILSYGKTIILAAKTQSGLLNAAYGLMRALWGFKVYCYDEFGVSEASEMLFGRLDITENPDFIGRDVHFKETMEGIYPYYASRMRLNGVRCVFTEQEGEGTVWCKRLWAHTQFRLLPKEKYQAEHPEWYSSDGTTLCWTNDEARRQLTENLKKEILNYPQAVFFSVTQEDGASFCECERCKASDLKYTHSGTMIRFVNSIAEEIEKWLRVVSPERRVYLVTFAYQNTLKAPVYEKEGAFSPVDISVIARKNVVVRLAPLYNCFSHDIMTSPCNKQFRNALLGWHTVAENLAIWSYCTGFGCYMVPFGNFETMQSVYKLYKKIGCIDVLDQGPSDTQATNLAWLRIFLQSELLWNTDADFEGLIEDFCKHFYREASPYMSEYIRLIRKRYKEIEQEQAELGECFHARPSAGYSMYWERGYYWTKEFVNNLMKLIDEALHAAEKISDQEVREKVLFRIKTESLTPRYMKINFYGYGEDKDKVSKWIDEYEKDAAECGLTHYREKFKVSFKMDEARRYIVDGSCFK